MFSLLTPTSTAAAAPAKVSGGAKKVRKTVAKKATITKLAKRAAKKADAKKADAKKGGAKKVAKKVAKKPAAKKASPYKRTSQKVVFKGKERTVYRKDGESFVRRKSAKTGKYYFSRV